jgi:DNA-binding LytR/AlgR family response regulator
VLDIRDGPKLVRAPVADIVAAEAAGNYVTILLRNGDRPLMRTTLTALEATLAPRGFLRVHRGWLVNRAHVRVVEPTGAGDYRLELACGVTAPLSRRYPAAVRALREGYVFKGPVMSSGRTQASN